MNRISVTLLIACLCSLNLISSNPTLGADRMDLLLPRIKDKKVALVVNHTSLLSNGEHLLDKLVAHKVDIKKIFAPEHGFRGLADAGETVKNGVDQRTGISVISLYGANKKPTEPQMDDIDVVIFDIQDVGARFYTYISTMFYVMEACAQFGKEVIILDRPNPCDFIDGPVLEQEFASFVGIVPVPILHGLTVGELAKMIKGEGWIKSSDKCTLTVIPMLNWKHGQPYSLPTKPSPNLPNNRSIQLYASLCLFEATSISVGRGTSSPFQQLGGLDKRFGTFTFVPKSLPGFDKNPLHKDKTCYGIDLRSATFPNGFTLKYLLEFSRLAGGIDEIITSRQAFNRLAGTSKLYDQILMGMNESEIKESWTVDLNKYKKIRIKYLIYKE
ncbi:MAG: exo-beta-N-acetylmuramidase NamZ domain-containing protein [Bacteroidales bacterium]